MPELDFVKSSYSNTSGECVEVALGTPHVVAVRDSKDPSGPILRLTAATWAEFTASLD
ncbi:DUF397 domain-containing protein [Streptomyces sp. INA 01156]